MKSQATVSRGQAMQFLSVVGGNVDWDALDPRVVQEMIDDPRGTGARLTAFLQNGGRLIVSSQPHILSLDRFHPFDPTTFIGQGWAIAEEDERSLALTEVDLTKVQLAHMLQNKEQYVNGEEKLARLKKDGRIRLDAKIFQTLWENPHLIPEAWKQKTGEYVTCVFFDGTILRGPLGDRYVLSLYCYDGKWRWGCHWLGCDFDAGHPSALLAS